MDKFETQFSSLFGGFVQVRRPAEMLPTMSGTFIIKFSPNKTQYAGRNLNQTSKTFENTTRA